MAAFDSESFDSTKIKVVEHPDSEPRYNGYTPLEAALDYAKRGWQVFPVPPNTKISCKSAKYSDGRKWGLTNDPEEIKRDFRQRPDAGVGIVTGPGSGIFVVDVDSPDGHEHNGIANWEELQDRHGQVPPTLMAKTPSGGLHYYFKCPAEVEVRNSTSKIAKGIDVRGSNGISIAPPTATTKNGVVAYYEWLNSNTIADPPQWLLDLLIKRATNGHDQAQTTTANAEASIEMIATAMKIIPNDGSPWQLKTKTGEVEELTGWDGWNTIMMALWIATEGSAAGYQIALEWCRKNEDKFIVFGEAGVWESWYRRYASSPPTQLSVGKIFAIANSVQPGFVADWKRQVDDPRRAEQIARNIEIGDDVTEPIFPTIMTLAEMQERLVFIGGSGGVVDRATGRLRKKEHAFAEYAASLQRYANRAGEQKEVPALKLWIASPQRVTVDTLAWVPGAPQICQPPEPMDGARTAFNSWRGIAPMDVPPDWKTRAEPFFEHVKFLVPNNAERERFLQWLAHIVQCPEVLPHTYYLMTTPTTGVGRNLMASIIVRVLRGHVAAGVSLPELLDGGFNGRLSQKLLAIVDEAREGRSEQRYKRSESLKKTVTEEYRHINPKYGLQRVEKNCCRWLMFSNHPDAIPFDNKDRRAIILENPTERRHPEYYENLFRLIDDDAFIGSVRRSLETLDISSFRPGAHAPMNDAKLKALYSMMSETDRAVLEFMEDCETELTTRTAIRGYVNYCISGEVNETHLTYAITRAGMTNTGRRIRIASTGRTLHSVVIVKGNWTPETVAKAAEEVLATTIGPSGFLATM